LGQIGKMTPASSRQDAPPGGRSAPPLRLEAAGATDRGRRDANEDAFLVDPAAGLFLVADGLGGLAHGEVASRLAVETVAAALADPGGGIDRPAPALRRAVEAANQAIFRTSRSDFSVSMGSTLVGLLRAGQALTLASVGDSRAYRYREGAITQLSEDHSLVMDLVRQGHMTREEAAHSPERHILSRALGLDDTVVVDIVPVPLRPGDVFLLCSDGLTGVMADAGLARLLARSGSGDLPRSCRRLIDAALDARSGDNITVVLVRVLPDHAPAGRDSS
jgi:protein phosphatase